MRLFAPSTAPVSTRGGPAGGDEPPFRSTDRAIVVSIHDVAPAYLTELRHLLADLDALGARPRVLKVVPHDASSGPLADYPAFVHLLQTEAANGSEIVLHGYTHRAAGPYRGHSTARLRAQLLAGDAAEFLSLDHLQMQERLQAGRQALHDLDLDPQGFCAPAWLAPPDLLPLLGRAGFRYYVGMSQLVPLPTGRPRWLPWAGYMGMGAWHERLVRLGGAVQRGMAARAPAVKVFFHPQRVPTSPDYQRTLHHLATVLTGPDGRQVTTYGRLLDDPRPLDPQPSGS